MIVSSLGQFMQEFKKLNRVAAIPVCKRSAMFAHGFAPNNLLTLPSHPSLPQTNALCF